MKNQSQTNFHSVDEEWLASYSAGSLSRSKRLLISCQAALKPELSERIAAMDSVGGALLESAKGEAVSDRFMDRVLGKLESLPQVADQGEQDGIEPTGKPRESWLPAPLADYLARSGSSIKWKKLGFGVERASIANDSGEELYLLKARPGLKIPQHSHDGEEWALILQGGYHVGEAGYARGDLHREDENCVHSPMVDEDKEACITLVAIEGGLRFSSPLMRIFKPVLGI